MTEVNDFIKQAKTEFEKNKDHFKHDITTLRTGRAQATLIENIIVEAYGVKSPLLQLASISVPDAKSISIEPWDKNILKDIEKAIIYSNLGLTVVNSGERLITQVQPMTEENRKDLIKVLGEKVELARISMRQVRDKVKETILKAEKDKQITEDDKYQTLADLDNLTSDYNKQIEKLAEEKEVEIMTV